MDKKPSASQYAKAKVQQIRKKFGYAHLDKQNSLRTSTGNQLPSASKTNVTVQVANKKTQILQMQDQNAQYNNRIKNIDVINQKINKFLKQTQKKTSQFKAQKSLQTKKQRRNVSELVQSTLINVQKSPTRQKSKYTEIKKNVTPKHQNIQQNKYSEELPVKKQQKYTNFSFPNSKQIVSIQLMNVPLSLEQLAPLKIKEVECVQKIKIEQKNQPTFKKQQKKTKQENASSKQNADKSETKKLAQSLSQLIVKDQKLRFSKFLFAEWQEPRKWQILLQKYKNLSQKQISLEDAKKLFILPSEEHNPFFQKTEDITEKHVQELIKNWQDAESYWNKTVKQCVSVEKLQKQSFSVRDIDLNKKGSISTQDIVCFVNLYAGNFFRNRDAISVFKRFIASQEKQKVLKYQSFLDVVTY